MLFIMLSISASQSDINSSWATFVAMLFSQESMEFKNSYKCMHKANLVCIDVM